MGQIADRANAVERQIQVFGGPRHPRRFHFYYRCAGGPEVAFFRSRLRNVVDRGDDACRGVRSVGEQRGPALGAVSNSPWRQRRRRSGEIRQGLRRIRYCKRPDGFRGDQDGGECAFGAGAVGDGGDFAAFPAAGSRPMHGQLQGLNLFPVGQQAGEFAGVRGDEEEEPVMRHRRQVAGLSKPLCGVGQGAGRRGMGSIPVRARLFRGRPTSSSSPCGRLRAVRGAGLPVRCAQAVVTAPAVHATEYGSSTAGALRPVMRASSCRIWLRVRFSEPRM